MSLEVKRREFLAYAAALAAGGIVGCKSKAAPPKPAFQGVEPRAPGGPRYVVQLLLSGGHDPVYTVDPKTRAQVEPDIDLPRTNTITEAAGLRFGEHFAPLQKHASSIAVLNGVQVGTANHDTGVKQFVRLKTRATDVMPGALDIIGTARDTQAVGTMHLGAFMRTSHSPKFFGTSDSFYFGEDNIFDMATAQKEAAPEIAELLRSQADQVRRASPTTQDNLIQVANLLERLPAAPTFRPSRVHEDYIAQSISDSLDRASWLIANDLTRCVFVDLGLLGWDTHIQNFERQLLMNSAFVEAFSRFLTTLRTTKRGGSSLLEQTLVVAGSDLGRFPKINAMNGKDHLPQTSYFFAGYGIAGGKACGQTDRSMKGQKMSFKTGTTDAAGSIPIVDDIGTTLMRLCKMDPSLYGYAGRTLECLFA
tara:strand:+ start:38944 stop:40206 length:1263 start_codon:yes stop_codon:yes gene_type:complete